MGTCPFPDAAHPRSASAAAAGDKDRRECHGCCGQPSCWDRRVGRALDPSGRNTTTLETPSPHPGVSQAPAQASPQPSRGKETLRAASLGTGGLSPAGFCLKALRGLIWAAQKQELPRAERALHCSRGPPPRPRPRSGSDRGGSDRLTGVGRNNSTGIYDGKLSLSEPVLASCEIRAFLEANCSGNYSPPLKSVEQSGKHKTFARF